MSAHVVESTCELSAFMKAGVMAGSERDAGFCSGGDEDDMSGLHSPSASEDSVEVQVTPISLRNKRKLAEPRKIKEPCSTAPLKKRRFEQIEETCTSVPGDDESRLEAGSPSPSPFRPWSTSTSKNTADVKSTIVSSSSSKPIKTTISVVPEKESPLLLDPRRHENPRLLEDDGTLMRLQETSRRSISPNSTTALSSTESTQQRLESCQRFEAPPLPPPPPSAAPVLSHSRLQEEPLSLVLRGEVPRVPSHPAVSGSFERPAYHHPIDHVLSTNSHDQDHQSMAGHARHQQGGQQRNYKNMTRERRIEANARERTRVHTISAAFDTLRHAIPAYSHNQKLSKLSVLRIACSYIMTLSKIVNTPEGESANGASLGACVDLVSRTIQTEGKLRKKKDD